MAGSWVTGFPVFDDYLHGVPLRFDGAGRKAERDNGTPNRHSARHAVTEDGPAEAGHTYLGAPTCWN